MNAWVTSTSVPGRYRRRTLFTGSAGASSHRPCSAFPSSAAKQAGDVFADGLNSIPGIHCLKPLGAFYLFPNISEAGLSSDEFVNRLLSEAGVAALPGTAFGDYGLIEEIARGGMGVVFEAEDDKLKRKVALKAMLPALAAKLCEERRLFFQDKRSSAPRLPVELTGTLECASVLLKGRAQPTGKQAVAA